MYVCMYSFRLHVKVLEAATLSCVNIQHTQVLSPPWSTQADAPVF